MPAHTPLPQAGTLRPVNQQITIAPSARTETRMKFFTNGFSPTHSHAIRQMGIDSTDPGRQRTFHLRIKMRHLMRCMNTRIGPASTNDTCRFSGDYRQSGFQSFLNGRRVRLALPSPKGCSAVFDTQGNSHQNTTIASITTPTSTAKASRHDQLGMSNSSRSGPASTPSCNNIRRHSPRTNGCCKLDNTSDKRTATRSVSKMPQRCNGCNKPHRPSIIPSRPAWAKSQARQSSMTASRAI